jgi:hypothetical protein
MAGKMFTRVDGQPIVIDLTNDETPWGLLVLADGCSYVADLDAIDHSPTAESRPLPSNCYYHSTTHVRTYPAHGFCGKGNAAPLLDILTIAALTEF